MANNCLGTCLSLKYVVRLSRRVCNIKSIQHVVLGTCELHSVPNVGLTFIIFGCMSFSTHFQSLHIKWRNITWQTLNRKKKKTSVSLKFLRGEKNIHPFKNNCKHFAYLWPPSLICAHSWRRCAQIAAALWRPVVRLAARTRTPPPPPIGGHHLRGSRAAKRTQMKRICSTGTDSFAHQP